MLPLAVIAFEHLLERIKLGDDDILRGQFFPIFGHHGVILFPIALCFGKLSLSAPLRAPFEGPLCTDA